MNFVVHLVICHLVILSALYAARDGGVLKGGEGKSNMKAIELTSVIEAQQAMGEPWLEFLRVPALSMGLYVLSAGSEDRQQPHTEDEIYYIVRGRAQIRVDDEDRAVQTGSIIYVAANVEHRFHTITEELSALVFFAPAEYTLQAEE